MGGNYLCLITWEWSLGASPGGATLHHGGATSWRPFLSASGKSWKRDFSKHNENAQNTNRFYPTNFFNTLLFKSRIYMLMQ